MLISHAPKHFWHNAVKKKSVANSSTEPEAISVTSRHQMRGFKCLICRVFFFSWKLKERVSSHSALIESAYEHVCVRVVFVLVQSMVCWITSYLNWYSMSTHSSSSSHISGTMKGLVLNFFYMRPSSTFRQTGVPPLTAWGAISDKILARFTACRALVHKLITLVLMIFCNFSWGL